MQQCHSVFLRPDVQVSQAANWTIRSSQCVARPARGPGACLHPLVRRPARKVELGAHDTRESLIWMLCPAIVMATEEHFYSSEALQASITLLQTSGKKQTLQFLVNWKSVGNQFLVYSSICKEVPIFCRLNCTCSYSFLDVYVTLIKEVFLLNERELLNLTVIRVGKRINWPLLCH